MSKKHISYFQSVITIGILSEGENAEEASQKARDKMLSQNGVNHCFFEQTNFELTETEEWKPEFETEEVGEGLHFKFSPNEETRNVIATRLQKNADELTEEDQEAFVKDAIETSLQD